MTSTRSKLAAALLAATMVLAGCLSSAQTVEVEPDGSGVMSYDLVLSPELVVVFSAFSDEPLTSESLVDELEADIPPELSGSDVTITSLDDVEGVGVRVEIIFDDLDELNTLLAPSEEGDTTSTFTGEVTRTGDRFEFRARAVPQEELTEDFGFGSADFGANLPEPSAMVTIRLPGGVVETNGTEQDGAVTWDLLAEDLPTELFLVTEPGAGGGVPWLLVAGGLLLVVAVGAGLAVLALRRGGSQGPGPGAPAAGPAPGPWPAAGPVPPAPAVWPPAAPQHDPTAWVPQAPAAPQHDPTAWVPQAPAAPQHDPTAWVPQAPVEPAAASQDPTAPAAPAPVPPGDTVQPTPVEPVAAPEPPADENLPPAGWYPDPQDPSRTRWWTGRQWAT